MKPSRFLRVPRDPVGSSARLLEQIGFDHRLPLGRVAAMRRLLRDALGQQEHALVIGHPGPVRQAWPTARLDGVGTDPADAEITVVSEALEPGSLPQRWDCVVITESPATSDRLVAAAGACRPNGVLAVMTLRSTCPTLPQHVRVERVLRSRSIQLVLARIPA